MAEMTRSSPTIVILNLQQYKYSGSEALHDIDMLKMRSVSYREQANLPQFLCRSTSVQHSESIVCIDSIKPYRPYVIL